MREIKFRAWHKRDKVMWEPTLVTCGSDSGAVYSYPKAKKEDNVPYFPRECELMQYTGMKDKNGKEIYEGDIVEVFNRGKWIVGYSGDMFTLRKTIEAKKCYSLTSFVSDYDKDMRLSYEIIGNIYQNPELIK